MAATERRNIAVFDCETWGRNPRRCELVQLAAVVLDGDTLAPLPGGEFVSYVKPADWNNYETDAINLTGITRKVLEEKGRDRKVAFEAFDAFCKQFRVKGAGFGGHPIAAGKNIRHFDLPILDRVSVAERMASKDGLNKFFDRKMVVDLEDVLWYWFQGRAEQPPSFKMDDLRTYLGMDQADHHEALMDARQEALVIKKFLLLHRRVNVKFQGALAGATL
jgi:DNA polymerase III alpha subunit (gram-positive type)